MPRTKCPKCGSELELTDDMVNQQIECGNCQQVFTAKAEGSPARAEDRPSRRPRDEDDRPSRRREDDDDDRPSRRRSRDDEDDDYDDGPRRRRRRPSSAGGGGQGLAIASLVMGIISLPLAFCCGLLGLPVAVIGAILGVVHLVQGKTEGKGLAIGGVVLCGIGVVLTILSMALGLALNMANFNKQNNAPPFGPQPANKRPFGR